MGSGKHNPATVILKRIPIYPILFGLVPVLALLAYNLDQIKPVVAWRSLIVISVVNLFFLIIFRIISRNRSQFQS